MTSHEQQRHDDGDDTTADADDRRQGRPDHRRSGEELRVRQSVGDLRSRQTARRTTSSCSMSASVAPRPPNDKGASGRVETFWASLGMFFADVALTVPGGQHGMFRTLFNVLKPVRIEITRESFHDER